MKINYARLQSVFEKTVPIPIFYPGQVVRACNTRAVSPDYTAVGTVVGVFYNTSRYESSEPTFGERLGCEGWQYIVLWSYHVDNPPIHTRFYGLMTEYDLETT